MIASGIRQVRAIDVHAHAGVCVDDDERTSRFMTGDGDRVASLAAAAGTSITCVSSLRALMPPGSCDAVAGNDEAAAMVAADPRLRLWAVLDPRRPESYEQVEQLIAHARCVGIKIHPESHLYPIVEHGRAIFDFAARHGAAVLTHSGEARSRPLDFVPFADAYPEVTLVLAHLGFGERGDLSAQVRAVAASRSGNVYADTSSMKSIVPRLLEWAVSEVGAERILYGTDSPLYFAPMQRARIDHAELPDAAKRLILRENARRLLPRLA